MFESIKTVFNNCKKCCSRGYLNLQQDLGKKESFFLALFSTLFGFTVGVFKATFFSDRPKYGDCKDQVLRALLVKAEELCHKNGTCRNDVFRPVSDPSYSGPDSLYEQCDAPFLADVRNDALNCALLSSTVSGVSLLTCYTLVKCKSYRSKRLGTESSGSTNTNSGNSGSDARALDTTTTVAESDSKLDNVSPNLDIEAQLQGSEQIGFSFDEIAEGPVDLAKPKVIPKK